MPIFALLYVENDSLRAGLVVETQLRGGLEVFSIRVVSQLTVLRQAESVQTALDV